MRNIDPIDHKTLAERVEVWLEEFPGDLICARQVWYEGLEGKCNCRTDHRTCCRVNHWQ